MSATPRIHQLRPDLTTVCGHDGHDRATFSRADVTCGHCRVAPATNGARRAREGRIEDYLFIGGPRLPRWQAAHRLGVSIRTIERYQKTLRQVPA